MLKIIISLFSIQIVIYGTRIAFGNYLSEDDSAGLTEIEKIANSKINEVVDKVNNKTSE